MADRTQGPARGEPLPEFAARWEMDGATMRCRRCGRSQHASRMLEVFAHASHCPGTTDERHPWVTLREIIDGEMAAADAKDRVDGPSADVRSQQGRVRYHAGSALDGGDDIGVTLGGTQHLMTVDDALALANRIIFTAVDRQDRDAGMPAD